MLVLLPMGRLLQAYVPASSCCTFSRSDLIFLSLSSFSLFIAQFQLLSLDYKLDVARLPSIIRELAAYHLHQVLS